MVKNRSLWSQLLVKFSKTNDEYIENVVKPLHTRPFQVSEGQDIGFAHQGEGEYVEWTFSKNKPNPDEYFEDEESVQNVPWHADGVGITTTYDFTDIGTYPLLRKQRISHVQVTGEAGAFVGTVEVSDDGGATYGPTANLDFADPNKIIWELNGKWLTHVRVTVTAGNFAIEVW